MKRKTITLAAVAFMITGTLPALATYLTPAEQAQAFATCAGRLSALAARQNAMHDPEFQDTHRLKEDFEMLLEATLPYSQDVGVDQSTAKLWQSYGWSEMAQLFRMRDKFENVTFSARAEADLNRHIHTCQRLILPG
jgi:hypothetical protein